jgi:hypothetical protein
MGDEHRRLLEMSPRFTGGRGSRFMAFRDRSPPAWEYDERAGEIESGSRSVHVSRIFDAP